MESEATSIHKLLKDQGCDFEFVGQELDLSQQE